MDGQAPIPGPAGHPFGIYFQATARQAGRSREDRVERLQRAAEFFEVDVAGSKEPNLLSFLADCVRLRAAAETDQAEAWQALRTSLQHYLRGRHNEGFARHYQEAWESLGNTPSVAAAEKKLIHPRRLCTFSPPRWTLSSVG